MLSYRHGFHAGNHADVLKHWVLTLCIDYLKQKEKPFYVIDTHAGAGQYSLRDKLALQTKEYGSGIGALWQDRATLPDVFGSYMALVEACNHGSLNHYPGSPMIASRLLRRGDRLRVVEQHTTESAALERLFRNNRQVDVIHGDGFAQLNAMLPPVVQRGLVIIDPSYELKSDYDAVVRALKDAVKRFSGGTYLLWYPLLNKHPVAALKQALLKLGLKDWLDVSLQICATPEGYGMCGSGLFLINPPWVLKEQLQQGLPFLVQTLGQDDSASFSLTGSA